VDAWVVTFHLIVFGCDPFRSQGGRVGDYLTSRSDGVAGRFGQCRWWPRHGRDRTSYYPPRPREARGVRIERLNPGQQTGTRWPVGSCSVAATRAVAGRAPVHLLPLRVVRRVDDGLNGKVRERRGASIHFAGRSQGSAGHDPCCCCCRGGGSVRKAGAEMGRAWPRLVVGVGKAGRLGVGSLQF